MEELDPAQTILVKWGLTVPFCWTVWDKDKVADMEVITHLVGFLYLVSGPAVCVVGTRN